MKTNLFFCGILPFVLGVACGVAPGVRAAEPEAKRPAGERSPAERSETEIQKVLADLESYQPMQGQGPLLAVDALVQDSHQRPRLRRLLETQLVRLLAGQAPRPVKQWICRQLWIIASVDSIPALAAMLGDEQTAEIACFALRGNFHPAAGRALRDALHQGLGPTRLRIIHLLGDRRDAEATGALSAIARGTDLPAAAAAIIALGKIGTVDAARQLREIAPQQNPQRQHQVQSALLQCAQELAAKGSQTEALIEYRDLLDQSPFLPIRRGALLGIMEHGGPEAISVMTQVLRGDNRMLQAAALAHSRLMPDRRVSRTMIGELRRAGPDLRVLLIEALAERDPDAVRPAITEQATHPDTGVRLAALRALGTIGNAETVRHLVQAAGSAVPGGGEEQAKVALAGLRRLSAAGVDDAIVQSLEAAESGLQVELIRVIQDRRIAAAAPSLIRKTRHAAPEVAKSAWKALGHLATPEDLDPLTGSLEALSQETARMDAEMALIAVCRRIPDTSDQAKPIIKAMQNTQDLPAKCSYVRILGGIANDQAFERICTALDSKNLPVRQAALRALMNWPDDRAAAPLLRVFRDTRQEEFRVLALRGYLRVIDRGEGAMPSAQARQYREILTQTRRPDEKKLILSALAQIPDAEALKPVLDLLSDPLVQAEADLAALQIVEVLPRSALTGKQQEALRKGMVDAERRTRMAAILDAWNTFGLGGCGWIWPAGPDGARAAAQENRPAGTVYFRKTVILPDDERVRQSQIAITADDSFVLYLNGQLVGRGSPWNQPQVFAVTERIKGGKNVLAVEATNTAPSPAGLIADWHITGNRGQENFYVTDSSWSCHSAPGGDWTKPSFDDSSWPKASLLGVFGCPPWGDTIRLPSR